MYIYIFECIYIYMYPYTGQPAKMAMLSILFSGTVIRCNFEPFLYWKKGNGRKQKHFNMGDFKMVPHLDG